MLKEIKKSERGVSLIEVLIALVILGVVAVGFLAALNNSGNSVSMADERATAESLARSQLEYARQQIYLPAPLDGETEYLKVDMSAHPNYEIKSVTRSGSEEVNNLADEVIAVPWDSENNTAESSDIGLQRIKLVILHNGNIVLMMESYKTNRN